jgi:hypothetical protein
MYSIYLSLEIAAVTFGISCEDMQIRETDHFYNEFLKSAPAFFRPDLEIHILLNSMPDKTQMKRFFTSEQSWEMFMDGEYYCMVLGHPESPLPFWISRMNSDCSEIKVFCSQDLIVYHNGIPYISNPVRYPLDQVILMYYLSRREGALFHAAGIGISNNGYIFAGRSGAGKTTISRQLIAENYYGLLSDDRVVVRKIDNNFSVFGTPWPGEGGIALNKNVPLSGIFFLSHDHSNRIEELSPMEAMERLLPVVSIPWYDAITMNRILSFCEDLISSIPAYTLNFHTRQRGS